MYGSSLSIIRRQRVKYFGHLGRVNENEPESGRELRMLLVVGSCSGQMEREITLG